MRKPERFFFVLVAFIAFITSAARPRTRAEGGSLPPTASRIEELTQTDLEKLDRNRTVFFLTFGNMEEHGPHLPVGSDYYRALSLRDRLIRRLAAAHPNYRFIVFPVIPLGEGGANDAAGQPEHIGTYAVRFDTLRNVAIDLGSSIARKGFQNIFIIEAHGAPLHNVALNQAARFISERYKVRMVNVTGISKAKMATGNILDRYLTKDWRRRSGFEGHAGAEETSEVLATEGAPFVDQVFKSLAPYPVEGATGFVHTYERNDWRGYWGDPASATRALGEALLNHRTDVNAQIAEKSLSGNDITTLVAYPDNAPVMATADVFVKNSLERYERQHAEVADWLARNPWPPTVH